MNDLIRQSLSDTVSFLNSAKIPFALIGGLAASVRGQPRVTVDVDMVILADVTKAKHLAASLEGTNFDPLFAGVDEVIEQAFICPLRHRKTKVKIDLALGLSGFEQQLVQRATMVDVAGISLSVATAEDILIMKIMAGRPQDEQDLRGILIAQGSNLDWTYCLKVASDLGDALGQDLVGQVQRLRAVILPE